MIPSQSNSRRHAFTLVELLVVIAIIGVLAGFTLVVSKSVGKSRKISVAKGELAQIQTALENYKATYGVYPPSNQNGVGLYTPKDRALFSQLYYELSGTKISGINFELLNGGDQIKITDVSAAYGVGGFVNCNKGGGEDAASAKNFLPSLSSKQVDDRVTNRLVRTTMLVTSVGGPDENYQPLDASGLNPIRYVYPGVNNPGGYDLWVQLVISGKTNLVCNWSKSIQINTSHP
jgi:prepilin-type N-terminal cleavage/methylation domain-containing protein